MLNKSLSWIYLCYIIVLIFLIVALESDLEMKLLFFISISSTCSMLDANSNCYVAFKVMKGSISPNKGKSVASYFNAICD